MPVSLQQGLITVRQGSGEIYHNLKPSYDSTHGDPGTELRRFSAPPISVTSSLCEISLRLMEAYSNMIEIHVLAFVKCNL